MLPDLTRLVLEALGCRKQGCRNCTLPFSLEFQEGMQSKETDTAAIKHRELFLAHCCLRLSSVLIESPPAGSFPFNGVAIIRKWQMR